MSWILAATLRMNPGHKKFLLKLAELGGSGTMNATGFSNCGGKATAWARQLIGWGLLTEGVGEVKRCTECRNKLSGSPGKIFKLTGLGADVAEHIRQQEEVG